MSFRARYRALVCPGLHSRCCCSSGEADSIVKRSTTQNRLNLAENPFICLTTSTKLTFCDLFVTSLCRQLCHLSLLCVPAFKV
eukprot:1673950-Rhodomonas_salina.1